MVPWPQIVTKEPKSWSNNKCNHKFPRDRRSSSVDAVHCTKRLLRRPRKNNILGCVTYLVMMSTHTFLPVVHRLPRPLFSSWVRVQVNAVPPRRRFHISLVPSYSSLCSSNILAHSCASTTDNIRHTEQYKGVTLRIVVTAATVSPNYKCIEGGYSWSLRKASGSWALNRTTSGFEEEVVDFNSLTQTKGGRESARLNKWTSNN